ncbi:MAG: dephospho-CoA kinase [Elusimicrobiota bacterium]|jgi:dephospho-CoA kinase|nr:dephospho-CoA kinase [Elusimicrobiota bacterium]
MTNFKVKGKIVIGLTGGVSAGKSAAAAAFKKAGAFVVCADVLAAKHLGRQMPAVQKYFKTSDKKQIAARVFKNAAERKWLENLLHPQVIRDAAALLKKSAAKIAVFDVPLLYEAGLGRGFDLTVCINAAYETRQKRSKFAAADFKKRDAAQMPPPLKAQKADVVIFNEGTKKNLEAKILKLYSALTAEN